MRLLFVVQRYGEAVLGGAEAYARQFASRMAERGHEVEVLTSCARSYVDWANVYPAGTTVADGVKVHRLATARNRDAGFYELRPRVEGLLGRAPLYLQNELVRLQGPYMPELPQWLEERSSGYDCTCFFTYLYSTTVVGMPASRAPLVLHPTAHAEPPIYLSAYDGLFRLPDGFAFLTPEEAAYVQRRFGVYRPSSVTGIGIEPASRADGDVVRRLGLEGRPYLVYVGRVDVSKGAVDLANYFARYKRRRPGPLALVYVGESMVTLPPGSDVVLTGFVDEATRDAVLAGARLLVQPSPFESFSIALCEAWSFGVPALVRARSDVMVAQARRSGGALAFESYAEFEAALDLLVEDTALRARMGSAGSRYVAENYSWTIVLERYERLLERVTASRRPQSCSGYPS